MKTITVSVSEPIYRDIQEYARRHDRTTSEVIREAMEEFHSRKVRPATSPRNLRPSSVGRVLQPFTGADDTLVEMTGDTRY